MMFDRIVCHLVRFSIAWRMGLLTALGIGAALVFASLYAFANARMDQAALDQNAMDQLAHGAVTLQSRTQSIRLLNEQFLQSRDIAFADQLQTTLSDARSLAGQVSPKLAPEFTVLTTHLTEIREIAILLGLTDQTGLRGALAASVKAIEDELKLWPNAEPVLLDMLRMREAERQFMLYGQDIFLGHHARYARQFDFALDATTLPPSVKADFRKLLERYTGEMAAFAQTSLKLDRAVAQIRSFQTDLAPKISEQVSLANTGKANAILRQDMVRQQAGWAIAISGLFGLLVYGLSAIVIGKSIIDPVRRMEASMRKIAKGHNQEPIPCLEHKDEIGDMAKAVAIFRANAQKVLELQAEHERVRLEAKDASHARVMQLAQNFEDEVALITAQIGSKAREIHDAAGLMAHGQSSNDNGQSPNQSTGSIESPLAERNQEQIWSLAIAEAAEQARQYASDMAKASEEFNHSVQDISAHAENVCTTAELAVINLAHAEDRVRALNDMARTIDHIVATIGDIADRTNMLSLNATIEASRAGEAGKGFAVVAGEVKRLAHQTASATRDIAAQIAQIQATTQDTVMAISSVGGSIRDMDHLAQQVKISVSHQAQVATGIDRCIANVTDNTSTLSNGVTNLTHATAYQCGAAAQILWAAEDLARPTTHLKEQVDVFLTTVRAG